MSETTIVVERIGNFTDRDHNGEMLGSIGWPAYSNGRLARWLRGGFYVYCDDEGWLATDKPLPGATFRWFRPSHIAGADHDE